METRRISFATKSLLEGSLLFPNNEKALKKAFYNGIALLLICISSVFAWGSFIILQPFLNPLFWALLCGSVLHPLKYKISTNFKTWIVWVQNRPTDLGLPIIVEIASFPLKLFLDLSEVAGESVKKHWKNMSIVFSVICLSLITYSYTPQFCVCLFWKVLKFILATVELSMDTFKNTTLVSCSKYINVMQFHNQP